MNYVIYYEVMDEPAVILGTVNTYREYATLKTKINNLRRTEKRLGIDWCALDDLLYSDNNDEQVTQAGAMRLAYYRSIVFRELSGHEELAERYIHEVLEFCPGRDLYSLYIKEAPDLDTKREEI